MTLQESTERVYEIRRLFEAGAVEHTAGQLRLSVIYESTDHPGLRALCARVAEGMRHPRQRPAPTDQGVESFAR